MKRKAGRGCRPLRGPRPAGPGPRRGLRPQGQRVYIFFYKRVTCSTAAITCFTRSSAIADGPRDASCQLKSCQLPRNSAETTCTTSPEQIKVTKLEGYSGSMCNKHVHSLSATQPLRDRVASIV